MFLLNLSSADSQLMPSMLSPVKSGSAKTNPKQTASTVVKREPDDDELHKTPICVAAKSKVKQPQRYSTPIEVSDSKSDAPTPQVKPRREEGSALRSRTLENLNAYVHPSSLFSPILSLTCPF